MKGTNPVQIEQPFEGDDKVYYVNGGRCSGKVDKTINELVNYINKIQQENEKLKADYGTQAQIERDMLQQENKILKENAENNDKVVDKVNWENMLLKKKNKQLKDKLSKIETLIINHNCDTGDIYYKYNSKFLKSELKQRILEILYEEVMDRITIKLGRYINEKDYVIDDVTLDVLLQRLDILKKEDN